MPINLFRGIILLSFLPAKLNLQPLHCPCQAHTQEHFSFKPLCLPWHFHSCACVLQKVQGITLTICKCPQRDEDMASSWQEKWHSLTLMWCLILGSIKCMARYLLTSWATLQEQKLAAIVTACELVQETGWGVLRKKITAKFQHLPNKLFSFTRCCYFMVSSAEQAVSPIPGWLLPSDL